jgi:multisubunit Na+/H+ antiporter MnhF subunit
MAATITYTLYLALFIHVALMAVALRRVWCGENAVDRLMGFDLLSLLTMAILVLLSIIRQRIIYIDVALGLVALGFVGTIALAKYLADEQLF